MENFAITNKDKRDYIFYLFLIVWAVALLAALVEVFTYSGFILKHVGVGVNYFIVASIFLGISALFFGKNEPYIIYSLIRRANWLGFFSIILAWAMFFFLEETNYPNYVYSKFHIQMAGLEKPFALSISLIIYELLAKFKVNFSIKSLQGVHIRQKLNSSRPLVYKSLILLLIIFILVGNIVKIASLFKKDILFMVAEPSATYDEKMRQALGKDFYDFTLFIKRNVSPDAKILIPPQGYPWPQTGNKFYLRYFVYPRELLNGKEYEPNHDYRKEGIGYVLVAWGESSASQYGYTNGWPKFDVPAEEIMYMTKDGSKEVENKDYVFKDALKDRWGVIKVKK